MYETVGEVYRKTTAVFLLSKTVLAERVGVGQPLSKNNEEVGGWGGTCRQPYSRTKQVLIMVKMEMREAFIGTGTRYKNPFSFGILHLLMARPLLRSGGWRRRWGEMEEERSVPGNSCPCNLY